MQIFRSNPGTISGGFFLGQPFSSFYERHAVEKMVDSSQFSLDGLAEDEPDSVLVCEEEKEVRQHTAVYIYAPVCGAQRSTAPVCRKAHVSSSLLPLQRSPELVKLQDDFMPAPEDK